MRKSVGALLGFGIATLVGVLATPLPSFADQAPYVNHGRGQGDRQNFVIEAENFDSGGEGVAYHDSTPENEPGAYRSEGVDVEASSVTSNGHDVGWVTPGEWLEYTINVSRASTFVVDIRYASDGPGGTIHLEVDGVDASGPIELPSTGGWQTWRTVRVPEVSMEAGVRVLRLSFDEEGADGWLANFDRMYVRDRTTAQQPSVSQPLRRFPGRIEAEWYDEGGEGLAYHDSTMFNEPGQYRTDEGVDVEYTSDPTERTQIGAGFDVGWVTPGEWLEYTVFVAEPGTYTLHVRYATLGFGGTMHIEFNGVDKTGPIQLPDTGDWQTWAFASVPNVVLADSNALTIMRLSFDTPGPEGWLANINYIQAERTGP